MTMALVIAIFECKFSDEREMAHVWDNVALHHDEAASGLVSDDVRLTDNIFFSGEPC
jgi:hypothetical protein